MPHSTNFFSSYVPTMAKYTATGVAIHSKERMYVFDSGASFHIMGLTPLNKQNSGCSDRHWHCGLRHTSEGLHQGILALI